MATEIQRIGAQPTPEMLAPERFFLRDLPQLLQTKPGRWVVYTPEGCIAEGDDELALFQECFAKGLQRGRFLVARVEPDAPAAEITENWFPHASPGVHNAAVSAIIQRS